MLAWVLIMVGAMLGK